MRKIKVTLEINFDSPKDKDNYDISELFDVFAKVENAFEQFKFDACFGGTYSESSVKVVHLLVVKDNSMTDDELSSSLYLLRDAFEKELNDISEIEDYSIDIKEEYRSRKNIVDFHRAR